ncbi:MAG: DUF167 domain-containing protein [Archangium sp.]|nr:DUF167 domain-containing protein [Archangium sp.]MDP3574854.1 DUF167 domain-containing protein [Archangium sp.]
MTVWLKEVPGGCELVVLVQPRASRTRVVGEHAGRLKIALAAPPVDGEANAALIEFLSDALNVRKSDVSLIEGQTSRRKRLAVRGVAPAQVMAILPK